jgi:DNA-binding NtrC family response regulator
VSADLGAATWITFAAGSPASLRFRRCRFEVIEGPDLGLVRDFDDTLIRVGAQSASDLQLSDRKVSGLHFELSLEEAGYRVRDLGSTNGTYLADRRINDAYLSPGDVIAVGDTRIRFSPLDAIVERILSPDQRFEGLVGGSPAMRDLFARLERIAATDATVLVEGETGTGKDLVAEAVHDRSPRVGGPFVVLDCGAVAPNVIESELFGHEQGAFTGATRAHAGAFERAHAGTLFLDEIGELPLDLQPKLLRAIERKEIRRVGGRAPIATDIRVIAATNRQLAVEVSRARFREDLYYRLAVAYVRVPPLRERKEDIPLLVEHFTGVLPGGSSLSLKQRTIQLMMKHDWPGNVRELRNMVERAALFADMPELGAPGVSAPGPREAASASLSLHAQIDPDAPFKVAKRQLVDQFELEYIRAQLARHAGNVSAVARACGVDRMTVHKIVQRFGLRGG